MPMASASTATAVKPGKRTEWRTAYRISWSSASMVTAEMDCPRSELRLIGQRGPSRAEMTRPNLHVDIDSETNPHGLHADRKRPVEWRGDADGDQSGAQNQRR